MSPVVKSDTKTGRHDIAEILLNCVKHQKIQIQIPIMGVHLMITEKSGLYSRENYLHFVLEQKAEKMLFQTNKYQKKVVTIDHLQSNLILLIEMVKQNKGKYANFIAL
jgi:hypothetical protein